jgi:hypothetical protein
MGELGPLPAALLLLLLLLLVVGLVAPAVSISNDFPVCPPVVGLTLRFFYLYRSKSEQDRALVKLASHEIPISQTSRYTQVRVS